VCQVNNSRIQALVLAHDLQPQDKQAVCLPGIPTGKHAIFHWCFLLVPNCQPGFGVQTLPNLELVVREILTAGRSTNGDLPADHAELRRIGDFYPRDGDGGLDVVIIFGWYRQTG